MTARYLGRHEFILEVPKLAVVGEMFNLSGPRFSAGAVGQVTHIIGQNAGKTNVRISLIKGQILSRNQKSRIAQQSDREEQDQLQEQLRRSSAAENNRRDDNFKEDGWMTDDSGFEPDEPIDESYFDPGNSGDYEDSSEMLGVDDWKTTETDSGAKILIKNNESTAPEEYKPLTPTPGRRIKKQLSSGDRDFLPKRASAPGISDLLSSVVGTSPPVRRGGAGFTQEEYAMSMNRSLDTSEGEQGGVRKSHVPDFGVRFRK